MIRMKLKCTLSKRIVSDYSIITILHGTGMWSRGRHFRIASRDRPPKTADSYISSRFNEGNAEETEYIGQIHEIVRLTYNTQRIVLLKGKWWNNKKNARGQSTTLITDECGFLRVYAKEFMPDNLPQHEPFVFPKDANQVFLVNDRLHPHWYIVVDTEVRKERPSLPEFPFTDTEDDMPAEEDVELHVNDFEVASDSEDENEIAQNVAHNVSDTEDIVSEEEILTYHRRRGRGTVHQSDDPFMSTEDIEDATSDDERAPVDEDFVVIEV